MKNKVYDNADSFAMCFDKEWQNFDCNDIAQKIDKIIENDDVVLFMKGTPDFPQCGFSANVVGILNHLGIQYQSYNVLEDDELRQGIKTYSDWPTIP